MPYRDDDAALQEEFAHWQAEEQRLSAAQALLERAVDARGAEVASLERRLAHAGPESGTTADPRTDRIAFAAWSLVIAALPWIFFEVVWQRYIFKDPTVIPALIWLGSPGWLAGLIALPFWRNGLRYRLATVLGFLLGSLPILEILLTVALGGRRW
ncbi:MAG: hypothetical protein CSB49_06640 [Proteobacteria bacterium]|nr:MAG: hypothetical protein CSB49_06640 [Pseudomonadota bacterium]